MMALYYYTAVSAFIFVLVAVGHLVRLFKQWAVQIGPFSVSMALSWLGLVVAALLAIWALTLLDTMHIRGGI
jgi:hypothetical protein